MPYPEVFRSRYTCLGYQTQTSEFSKVLISGVSFHHRSLSQSHESDILSYSEYKIVTSGVSPLDPTREGFQPPPSVPDSPVAQWFFSSLGSSKNRHPPKNAGYGADNANQKHIPQAFVCGNVKHASDQIYSGLDKFN